MTIATTISTPDTACRSAAKPTAAPSNILVTDLSIDGADNGIRIKSNSHKGGLVHDIVYEDVCIRDTKNPIYMDSDYEHGGRDGKILPQFTGIVLRNVRIIGGGKMTLNGYDATHKLGMLFDNVTSRISRRSRSSPNMPI